MEPLLDAIIERLATGKEEGEAETANAGSWSPL
jgi:hypothetical protein